MTYKIKAGFENPKDLTKKPTHTYIEYFKRPELFYVLEETLRAAATIALILFGLLGLFHAVVGNPTPSLTEVGKALYELTGVTIEPQIEETKQP